MSASPGREAPPPVEAPPVETPPLTRPRARRVVRIAFGTVVALVMLSMPFVLSRLGAVRAATLAAIAVMRDGGALGIAAYFATYAGGVLATAPNWIFSGMAGYAYGPVRGILLASPANLVGATLAFLVGRFLLARKLRAWLAQNTRWPPVQRAVEADAFRIGLLVRLSPLAPQNLLSFGFSLTSMRLPTFMAVTWIGMLPITCFQVYVGSLVHDFTELMDGTRPPLGAWGWVASVAAVVVSVAAIAAITVLGRRALARHGILAIRAEP
jgi:uncharacterized membrane protein YdjX (TVP38/TMEM64 family)